MSRPRLSKIKKGIATALRFNIALEDMDDATTERFKIKALALIDGVLPPDAVLEIAGAVDTKDAAYIDCVVWFDNI